MSTWLSRFAGVAVRPQTWLNLVYLLVAFPLGLTYFVVLVIGVSLGAALAVIVVGLGILLAMLVAWRGMAAIERGFARVLLGVQIARPLDLLARRRREAIATTLGARALALDDHAQALAFVTRSAGHAVLGGDAGRPRAQLAALRRARREPVRLTAPAGAGTP